MDGGTQDHDTSHLIAEMTTLLSREVYDTFMSTRTTRMRYRQGVKDYLRLSTERNISTERAFLARATINIILLWLFWKGIMLLLFLFTMSLIADIIVSTVVSGEDGYEGITGAVRLAQLHLIWLIMAILAEFWRMVRTALMACTLWTFQRLCVLQISYK